MYPFAKTLLCGICLGWILPSGLFAQILHGEALRPDQKGAGIIESIDDVEARQSVLEEAERTNPKARKGRPGEWIVPSPRGKSYPCSGSHSIVNLWGDTRMGIGFGKAVHVHGAFFAGQAGAGVWARRIRVHGFRGGEAVAHSDWFEGLNDRPRWLDIDLFAVDRIEIEAQPVLGDSAWYGLDDFTFTVLDASDDAEPTVVTFDDCHYGQRLTGSGYAGLVWELGRGAVSRDAMFHDAGMSAPKTMPRAQSVDGQPRQQGPQTLGGGGTLPTLDDDFQGVIRGDSGSFTFPPDSCGTIGPSHFVEVVNRNLAIYERFSGLELSNVQLNAFMPGASGDPRVLYDQYTGRWVVLATDFNADERIFVAVSLTSDPLGAWFKTEFVTNVDGDEGCWPDYPTLGLDENGIYTAVEMIGCQMTIFAIDKAPLIDASPSLGTVTAFRNLPIEGAVQPVHTFGDSDGEYFLSRQSSTELRVRRIDGPLSAPTLLELGTVIVPASIEPPNVPALDSATPLDSIDARLMNAINRRGSLFTTHTIDVAGRAACRWYQIDVDALTLEQSGTVDDGVLSYFYPSIAVNGNGDMVMGFSGASASQYAAAYYTGRSRGDFPGQMAVPALLQVGVAPQNNIDQLGRNRWGDYSMSSVDPLDDHTLWTVQEYAHDQDIWGTWVASFSPLDVCTFAEYCADDDEDGRRDDNCLWWECVGAACVASDIVFADMGGPAGDCQPDGAADGNDRFHALNCFSDRDTLGQPGYPCEPAAPNAFNVDAGGEFGACAADGVCDGHDAFHALNTFQDLGTCSCPLDPPAPQQPAGKQPQLHQAALRLSPATSSVRQGQFLTIDVLLDAEVRDIRGYQLHLAVKGGKAGTLQLVDMSIESRRDHLFADQPFWRAFNSRNGQMLAGLDGPGIESGSKRYLATYVYEVSSDAAGSFTVEILHEGADRTQRTFLFPTAAADRFELDAEAVRIDVLPDRRTRG